MKNTVRDKNQPVKMKKRVFIVGCPRSGTTLLQSMLMGHPDIHSFPETHFFQKVYGGRKSLPFRILLKGLYAWVVMMLWRAEVINLGEDVPIPRPYYSMERAVESFITILDNLALGKESKIWVEKTPAHLKYIDIIAEMVSESAFVHIVRDGRAVVASLYNVMGKWGKEPSISSSIQRWNESIQTTMEYLTNSNHFILNYHQLIDNPEFELKKVTYWLGVDFNKKMCDYSTQAQKIVLEKEEWKSNVHTELLNPGLKKYYEIFSINEREMIENTLDFDSYHELINNISTASFSDR